MSRDDAGMPGTTRGTFTHRLERNQVPLGMPLAVEFNFRAPDVVADAARAPLSLGFAIDRSGSMAGDKLQSAALAASGVLEALQDGERFAAAAFDDHLIDLSPSVQLNDEHRSRITTALGMLQAGGSTALFDGFARAAELVALGTDPSESDSWVLVLSDGMGNHGLVDPASMRTHAAALADRGIRTISIGIGDDYEAAQLNALSDGGSGAFHHASRPGEIVEIVLGELRALRHIAVRDLEVRIAAHQAHRFSVLGGEVLDNGGAGTSRFARVGAGREVRVVALVWPRLPLGVATLDMEATWEDAERGADAARVRLATHEGPVSRDVLLAQRAARLWHARIVSTALELNERGAYEEAASYVRRWERRFLRYVAGVPEVEELVASLSAVGRRVGRQWRTAGHKEAYVMARKAMAFEIDVRDAAPATFSEALERDNGA